MNLYGHRPGTELCRNPSVRRYLLEIYQFPSKGVIPHPTGPSAMTSPEGRCVIRMRLATIYSLSCDWAVTLSSGSERMVDSAVPNITDKTAVARQVPGQESPRGTVTDPSGSDFIPPLRDLSLISPCELLSGETRLAPLIGQAAPPTRNGGRQFPGRNQSGRRRLVGETGVPSEV